MTQPLFEQQLVSFSASASAGEFMNVDLGFNERQYSFLASFGFTLLFAVSSLFAGRVADKNDRAKLSAGSCALWGLATIATGMASSFEAVN
jgi:MFS family permease